MKLYGRKLYQILLLSLMLLAGGLPAAQAAPEAEGAGGAAVDTTVSLNNAGVAELQTLKGIGPKTAASIVAWREREGPFESVDQLMAVKGIGEKTLSRIRDRLSL
ncbi:MAG TPA: helix-hairpin-helix domain-containing protein [Alcanivorax sp.]|nr:helix-hairpin-helix domain-containing protein [Alcanivorax sp.]